MPSYRSRRYRRRYGARRPYRARRASGMRSKYGMRGRIPLYMNPARRGSSKEIKAYDQDFTGITGTLLEISAPPVYAGVGWLVLNDMLVGTAGYERVGSRVMCTSVEVEMVLNGLTTAAIGTVRYIIVVDKQPNGAGFTIGDLLQDNIAGGISFQSGMNMANKNRFQIMRDSYVTIDPQNTVKHEKCYVKCRVPTDYVQGGGGIASITTGGIHLIVFAENLAAGAGDKIEMHTVRARVRYED